MIFHRKGKRCFSFIYYITKKKYKKNSMFIPVGFELIAFCVPGKHLPHWATSASKEAWLNIFKRKESRESRSSRCSSLSFKQVVAELVQVEVNHFFVEIFLICAFVNLFIFLTMASFVTNSWWSWSKRTLYNLMLFRTTTFGQKLWMIQKLPSRSFINHNPSSEAHSHFDFWVTILFNYVRLEHHLN